MTRTARAGDAFTAGLLDALVDARAATPAGVGSVDARRLGTILGHATTVAAITCTRPGADPPHRIELCQEGRSTGY